VLEQRRTAGGGRGSAPKVARAVGSEAFSRDELKTYFAKNAALLKRAAEKASSNSGDCQAVNGSRNRWSQRNSDDAGTWT